MDALPTIEECSTWILEHCQTILTCIEKGKSFDSIKEIAQTTYDRTITLIDALDISKKDKTKLYNKLDRYSKFKQNNNTLKLLILNIKDICYQILQNNDTKTMNLTERDYLSILNDDGGGFYREKSRILKTTTEDNNNNNNNSFKVDYNMIWPDQIDKKAYWFRNHFIGKPYITLIGPMMDDEDDLAIMSVVKEPLQYRVIVRAKQDMNNMGFTVNESDIKELILQLDESHVQNRHKPLRSFSSAIITGMTHHQYHQYRIPESPINHHQSTTGMMRAALSFLFHDVNFKLFKELSAEATIMSGLEKEFLRYDEIGIPKCYKFGVLTIKDGQDTEEEWFSNSGLSSGLERLLNIVGKPVELKDYQGYAAGLDTKTGESGEISFVSSWRDHEIMFHVASLMPSKDNDSQQVHRKRYIGNDIVCIVFIEGEHQKFDPSSIRSQLLHVFILVKLQIINDQDTWRVEVICNSNVKEFSPRIPSPPIFDNEDDLKEFLILKLINAEHASLKSKKFTLPNNKARLGLLKTLVEMGVQASQMYDDKKIQQHQDRRPKSAGPSARSNNIDNSTILESSPVVTTMPPPMPSRSNVLLKSLTRRKSGNGIQPRLLNGNRQLHQQRSMILQKQQSSVRFEEEKRSSLECLVEDVALTVIPSPSVTTTSTTSNGGGGIRSKAQSLISMLGRRNSRSGDGSLPISSHRRAPPSSSSS